MKKSIVVLKRLFIVGCCSLFALASICDNGGTPPVDAGLYHTYAELQTELAAISNNYPDITHLKSIGKSLEGREIWALKISDNVETDEDEPVAVFLGAHHAREWISVEVPLMIGRHCIENYAGDARFKNLVDNAEIWIVPMVNPDGHHYSVMVDRLWRKNRRNNRDGSYGVDLNRNYGYQWGGPGSSGDTFSEIYRGPAPFSEPETQAMRDFLTGVEPDILISYHNFSQLILFPWGFTDDPAPDKIVMNQLAVAMSDKIRMVHGEYYRPGQASTLYLSSGDTCDWLYALLDVPAYTIELRPEDSYPGFELPEDEIQPTFEENLPAALYLTEWIIEQE